MSSLSTLPGIGPVQYVSISSRGYQRAAQRNKKWPRRHGLRGLKRPRKDSVSFDDRPPRWPRSPRWSADRHHARLAEYALFLLPRDPYILVEQAAKAYIEAFATRPASKTVPQLSIRQRAEILMRKKDHGTYLMLAYPEKIREGFRVAIEMLLWAEGLINIGVPLNMVKYGMPLPSLDEVRYQLRLSA